MSMKEAPLAGGRVTAGVVRIGNTVRRPITTDRTHVQDLLVHLERKRFDGAPRFLGIDDLNREILSFLPGEVPNALCPFSDAQLAAAARLFRRFHDATADFPLVRTKGAETLCHNDWGPTNAVFRDGLPCGLIDFDTIAAGFRLWDLGYSAWVWLDLGNAEYSGDTQIRRLSLMAQAYDMPHCSAAAIAIHALARQTTLIASGHAQGNTEMADWAGSAASWTVLNVTERLSPTGYGLPIPP